MGNSFNIVSPIDGSIYATRTYATSSELAEATTLARSAFREWAAIPLSERTAMLRAATRYVAEEASALAKDVSWSMGRPLFQADETPRLVEAGDQLIAEAEQALARVKYPGDPEQGIDRFVERRPLGVCLSICAWNYPVAMPANLIVAPLAAGNVVIFKHAPQTAIISDYFERAFKRAGVPAGVFQCLNIEHAQAERLIGSDEIDTVHFIGSTRGGMAIHRAAADKLSVLGLEMGGKDPVYIRPDANLDIAIPDLIGGCFGNAGQSCCSVERIYVHDEIYSRFIDQFMPATRDVTLGHPIEDKPFIGPVVSVSAADRIKSEIEASISMGARSLLTSQKAPDVANSGAYLSPHVLVDVDHSMPVMKSETFGPVASIMKVGSDAEAIRLMNDSEYGLTAGIYTNADSNALDLLNQLEAGTIFLNRCDHADLYLPWGGVKKSGVGRINGGVIGYQDLTKPISYHVRRAS